MGSTQEKNILLFCFVSWYFSLLSLHSALQLFHLSPFAAMILFLRVQLFVNIPLILLYFLHAYSIIVLVAYWCCHNPSWSASYGVRRSEYIPQGEKERGEWGWDQAWQERWQHISFAACDLSLKFNCFMTFYHPLLPRWTLVDHPLMMRAQASCFLCEHDLICIFMSVPIGQLRANKPKW